MHLGKTPEEIELQRKLLLMRFFAVAGNLVMVPLMVISVFAHRWEAAFILLLVVIGVTSVIVLAHKRQRAAPAGRAVAVVLWVFSLYLTITGGVDGTGVYFSFSLVVLMIMVAGMKTGFMLGVSYCVLTFAAFTWNPSFAYPYEEGTRVRIGASTAFIVLLTLVAEWIHLQSYAAIKFTAETHRRNSLTDPLTTLVNRAGLERGLKQWSNPRQQAVVALLDIDHFKNINDEFGHDIGDKVLLAFAKVLRNNVKQEDLVCRWGGEEFVILFENVSERQAAEVVDSLRDLVASRTFSFGEQEIKVRFSAGVAEFEGEAGFHEGLKRADQRVYHAKRSGRNQVVAEEPALNEY